MASHVYKGEKSLYHRLPVWGFVQRSWKDVSVKDRKVMYLDTGAAIDTQYLLKIGYRPENLYVINYSAGHIASVQRKVRELGYIGVNTVSGDIFDIAQRFIKNGMFFHAIIVDSMTCIHKDLLKQMGELGELLVDRQVFGLNALRGRETWWFVKELANRMGEVINGHNDTNEDNYMMLARHYLSMMPIMTNMETGRCRFHINDWKAGVYQSNIKQQTMWWYCIQLKKHGEVDDLDVYVDPFISATLYGVPSCINVELYKWVWNAYNSYRY